MKFCTDKKIWKGQYRIPGLFQDFDKYMWNSRTFQDFPGLWQPCWCLEWFNSYVFFTGTIYCVTWWGWAISYLSIISCSWPMVLVVEHKWETKMKIILISKTSSSSTSLSASFAKAEEWAPELVVEHTFTVQTFPFSIQSRVKLIRKMLRTKPKHDQKRIWTNQMQIKIPDWVQTVNFHCNKYYREYDSLGILMKFGRRSQ